MGLGRWAGDDLRRCVARGRLTAMPAPAAMAGITVNRPRATTPNRKENTMKRIGMTWRVNPANWEEYKHIHLNPWPELIEAIQAVGIHNYSIYAFGTRVFADHGNRRRRRLRRADHPGPNRHQEEMGCRGDGLGGAGSRGRHRNPVYGVGADLLLSVRTQCSMSENGSPYWES